MKQYGYGTAAKKFGNGNEIGNVPSWDYLGMRMGLGTSTMSTLSSVLANSVGDMILGQSQWEREWE